MVQLVHHRAESTETRLKGAEDEDKAAPEDTRGVSGFRERDYRLEKGFNELTLAVQTIAANPN